MSDSIQINDRLVRVIGILFFGIVIPNATGLIAHHNHPLAYLVLAYLYFVLIAFLIWQGNRFMLFKLEEKYNWFINPMQKVIMILGGNVFYTAPLVVLMLFIWYSLHGQEPMWEVIKITAIVCVVCVIFVTHVYETTFLIKQRASDVIKAEQLEKARIQAQLEALKNQIDPHFMFKSLNSLSYLIDENPAKAKKYTSSLAEVYRYILANKNQKLVMLEDELLFLNKYLSLLQLRFGPTLNVQFDISKNAGAQFLIPPISIFIALENVVKHNEISTRKPMEVSILQENNKLHIKNKLQLKTLQKKSSKIGLNNLNERFKIIIGQGIKISENETQFNLELPLLTLDG